MKVTRDKIENNQVYLTVEMEPDDMKEPMEDSYRRIAKKVNIPGFRRGKAPRNILEKYVGRESVLEEAIKHVVPQAYEKAVQEQEIVPFAQPEIEITKSEPVVFTAVVPLPPNIELGDYHDIRMEQDPVEITDDNVNDVIEELRHQHAAWESVDRTLNYNDLAVIDINSEIEEKPFIKKLGVQYQVVRDSVSPVPGFAEQLVGMKKEEEKEFKLSLPDDYPQKEVAGKEVSFRVKLSEIKEEKLPEMNDELAVQVSSDFKTVETLREEVSKSLKQRAEDRARMDYEERVINAVVEQAKVDYPPVLVEIEINRLINNSARQFQMSGRSMEDYLRTVNKTEQQLRDELRPVATKNVTASLVMGKAAEAEKIEVENADIDAEIERMTIGVAEDSKEEMKKVMDTPQTRESIKQSLMMKKTMERLVEIAKNPEITQAEVKEEKQ